MRKLYSTSKLPRDQWPMELRAIHDSLVGFTNGEYHMRRIPEAIRSNFDAYSTDRRFKVHFKAASSSWHSGTLEYRRRRVYWHHLNGVTELEFG